MFNDFRKFILRGNIVELLIGFTVGASFSTVAKSLVSDILMPPIGLVLGQTDFSNFFFVLKNGNPSGPYQSISQAQSSGAITLNVGSFLNNVISLLVVGIAVYILIKFMNRIHDQLEELPLVGKKKKGDEEPSAKKCPFCLTTIPFRATKCSACTSTLPTQEKK